MSKSLIHDNSFSPGTKPHISSFYYLGSPFENVWISTSTLLAHIRSLILCTVTTSVVTLGLQAPSLNICNYC